MIRKSPNEIWKIFQSKFPENAKDVNSYREEGSDSIVLYFKTGYPLKFTLTGNGDWRLTPYRKF